MGDIMKGYKNIIWGLLFIIVGIIVFTNSFGITNITIFFDGWWTLFIIVPCFIGLFKDEDKSGNLIGLIIGICLLLGCIDIIEFTLISTSYEKVNFAFSVDSGTSKFPIIETFP